MKLKNWKMQMLTLGITLFATSNAVGNDAGNKIAVNGLVHSIRDPNTGMKKFRKSVEKIGEYMAIEVMQDLLTKDEVVKTLTGADATDRVCSEDPVLITILRAGIPLLHGMQKVFSSSEVGFLGIARNEETLLPFVSYIGIPEIKDKTVIIADTMLATAGSFLATIKILEQHQPKEIIVVCAIAAIQGIENLRKHNPSIKVYSAAIDPQLNEKGYIVPGLGDAGDRSYGKKI